MASYKQKKRPHQPFAPYAKKRYNIKKEWYYFVYINVLSNFA